MKIERQHLIAAIENAIKKLGEAATGRHTVPTPVVWEVIGELELTRDLANKPEEKGEEHGDEERSEDERA